MKAAIIVLSDPKSGSEEALGRVFNALAAAYDFKQQGDEVTVRFQGTGTRWIGELSKAEHPAHVAVEPLIVEHNGDLIDARGIGGVDDSFHGDITEVGDLPAQVGIDRLLGTTDDGIGLDAPAP